MATLGDVVDFVLDNVGKADAGEPRTRVLEDVVDLLTVDLPAEVGGYLSQGFVEISVGYTGSLSESGVYQLPATLRTVEALLGLTDDASLSTPPTFTAWTAHNTFTDPDDFYYMHRYGNAHAANPYGRPQYALVYANEIHLRPIPKQTGDPLWFGKLLVAGSVVQDFAGATEATVITNERLVPAVKAGATVLHAGRERRTDVAQIWAPIYEKRKAELQRLMASFPRNLQAPRDY